MENSEKIKIIQHHNNLLGKDCPCTLRATGKLEIHDESRMPKDEVELEQWKNEMIDHTASIAYKGERSAAYEAAGLTFDAWTELVIEKNTAGQTAFRAARDLIKEEIPKPV